MAVIGAITSTLYYVIYPVLLLATGLLSVVSVFLIPFVYLGRVILYLLLVPVRIMTKFEVRTWELVILSNLLFGPVTGFTFRLRIVTRN